MTLRESNLFIDNICEGMGYATTPWLHFLILRIGGFHVCIVDVYVRVCTYLRVYMVVASIITTENSKTLFYLHCNSVFI